MGNVADQLITDKYALYNGDCMEVLPDLADESIHLSVYSPPFGMESGGALYHYTSSERDLSNARTYTEFLRQYEFIVEQISRVTMPGRISAVHCADIPTGNTGRDGLADFPGDIIRLHRKLGFEYIARYHVWKEPLGVRNRTMRKGLTHKSIVDDSSLCEVASADYLLTFRRHGTNPVPVTHEHGLTEYYGSKTPPGDVLPFRNWTGNQIENRYSQWVWRQYASAFWDDVRIDNVLPYREARDSEDERHVHPLQLDVIARTLALRANPGERVLTPFMGVGSEVFQAVRDRYFGIGIELKPSYYRQAIKNLRVAEESIPEQRSMFDLSEVAS